MDRAEMHARVADARVARLATVRADGSPHLVPICFALEPDAEIAVSIVDAKPKRSDRLQRFENVRVNPAVSLLVDHYDDDWTQLWWVRIDGTAAVCERGPAHERAVELLASKYEQYRAWQPSGTVLLITLGRWTAWSGARSAP
jgi:PPOX class probable F420-dependent enzyme